MLDRIPIVVSSRLLLHLLNQSWQRLDHILVNQSMYLLLKSSFSIVVEGVKSFHNVTNLKRQLILHGRNCIEQMDGFSTA